MPSSRIPHGLSFDTVIATVSFLRTTAEYGIFSAISPLYNFTGNLCCFNTGMSLLFGKRSIVFGVDRLILALIAFACIGKRRHNRDRLCFGHALYVAVITRQFFVLIGIDTESAVLAHLRLAVSDHIQKPVLNLRDFFLVGAFFIYGI